jgi:hypothetical protein
MVGRILWTLPLLAASFGLAGDATVDRATLKGIKAVGVIVDQLPQEFAKEGITADAIQARLADRLQDANITVDPAAKEFIGVRATSVRASRGPYAVNISVGVYQPVTLVRDSTMRAAPPTWEVETILMADPKLLYRAAMDSVDDLAGRFVAAYRSVNPQ